MINVLTNIATLKKIIMLKDCFVAKTYKLVNRNHSKR